MSTTQRTQFTDQYLLEKVRAIAGANRDKGQACQKVLGLVQEIFDPPTWIGLYVRDGKRYILTLSRGDVESEFPSTWSPEKELNQASKFMTKKSGKLFEIRIPIEKDGRIVGLLRIHTLKSWAVTAQDQKLLNSVAQQVCEVLPPIPPPVEEKPARSAVYVPMLAVAGARR